VLFRLRVAGTVSAPRLGGMIACVAVAPLGAVAPAIVPAALLLAILAAVVAVEARPPVRTG
jgi:hypothetical protein